jgi:hypothetical protein
VDALHQIHFFKKTTQRLPKAVGVGVKRTNEPH